MLLLSGAGDRPHPRRAHRLQPARGAGDRRVRAPGAARLPAVVLHQARRMNGFDSYRAAGARRHGAVDPGRRVPRAGRRVLPDPGPPAREVPAQGRNQPAPARSPSRRPAAAILDRQGRDHRRKRSRVFRQAARAHQPTRSARCWRGSGSSSRSTPAEVDEIVRRFAQARYQPAIVFGDANFETVARLEEHRFVLPGLVIQAEPKRLYPAGKAVAHLVGIRLGGDRAGPRRQPLSRRRAGLDRGQGGAGAGVRRHAPGRRGRALHRGQRARPAGAGGGGRGLAAARRPASRSRPRSTSISSDSSTASGRRASAGAMVAMTPDGRDPRAVLVAHPTIPTISSAGSRRAEWRALNTDEARPLLNRVHPGPLPAGLAIQAGDLGDGAEARARRTRHPHAAAVPRRTPAGQPGLPLLEEGGSRLARSGRARWPRAATSTSTSWGCAWGSTPSSRTAC